MVAHPNGLVEGELYRWRARMLYAIGQKIQENSWTDRELNSVLNEQEKLRTLSDSTAQVVFRDASRLRLNPNSQAVIQRMRDDPLSRRKEAQISLVEGDFYALLAPESERSKLEVSLKNVDAKIDSEVEVPCRHVTSVCFDGSMLVVVDVVGVHGFS